MDWENKQKSIYCCEK